MKTWFKFYGVEYLADPKMDLLNAVEKALWITILCYASISDEEGVIRNIDEDQIMKKTNLNDNEKLSNRNFLNKFATKKYSMISIDNEDNQIVIKLLNYEKRQKPLTDYERLKNYRERQKIDENLKKQPQKITKSYQNDNNIDKNREEKNIYNNDTPPSSGSRSKTSISLAKQRYLKKIQEIKSKSIGFIILKVLLLSLFTIFIPVVTAQTPGPKTNLTITYAVNSPKTSVERENIRATDDFKRVWSKKDEMTVKQKTLTIFSDFFGEDHLSSLEKLMNGESHFNPYAGNPDSGACGIFQAYPCEKLLKICGSLDNVDCQIEWGKYYIKSRYGDPTEAYKFWLNQSPHWY